MEICRIWKLWKLQEANEVLNEVIQWVVEGKSPQMQEKESTRSNEDETDLQSYVVHDK